MRVIFMGTGEIGEPPLRALARRGGCEVSGVVTGPDRRAGRDMRVREGRIKQVALELGIPVMQPEKLRDPGVVAALEALGADVIAVMAYGQLLPKSVLGLPPVACLNLHASLLPKFRGASPIQAAILAGERETGITAMHMAPELDAGDMLLQASLPIRRRETGGTLHDRLAYLAADVMERSLDLLASGVAPRTPQDPAAATYAAKLTRRDAAVDWRDPAARIERKIRAFDPWPSAEVFAPVAGGPDVRLKVYSAIVFRKAGGAPGEVLRADRRGILVACGDGALLLRQIQPDGKRRMSAGEWLAGNRLDAGRGFRLPDGD